MWWEVICVFPVLVVIYKFFKRLFYGGDVASGLPSSSDATSLFSVVGRYCFESNFVGQVKALAVGLQIPDIDLLLQFPREAMLISVKNDISGFVTIDKHGKWICTSEHQTIRIPDPVAEAKLQVSILESHLQQRGLDLPPGYISCKVMCLNPNFHPVNPGSFPSEVITREEFDKLKSETTLIDRINLSLCENNYMQESLHEKLDLVIKTARLWDRLSLKGGQFILGEFLDFKGKQDDVQALQNLRRSKVFCLIFPETNMFGLAADLASNHFMHVNRGMGSYLVEMVKSLLFFTMGRMRTLFKLSPSNITIFYNEGNQVTVSSNTEIVFQARHSTIVRKYKLSSVTHMTLSP